MTVGGADCSELYNSAVYSHRLNFGPGLLTEDLFYEDTFSLGITLLQFACSISQKDLLFLRVVPLGKEMPLADFARKLVIEITHCRDQNFPLYVKRIIEHLNPQFPPTYSNFIQSLV